MVDNTSAFFLWLEHFISLFSYHFSRMEILGYSLIDIMIGLSVLTWLLHKLALYGNSWDNLHARNTPDMMKKRRTFAGKVIK